MNKFQQIQKLRNETMMTWAEIAYQFGYKNGNSANAAFYQWKKETNSISTNISNGDKIPTYKEFIQICRDNPDIAFAEQMIRNCETTSRKHWRSIVNTTIDMIKYFNDHHLI